MAATSYAVFVLFLSEDGACIREVSARAGMPETLYLPVPIPTRLYYADDGAVPTSPALRRRLFKRLDPRTYECVEKAAA